MIAAAALGDVMQEHSEVERATRYDRFRELGGERMIFLQQPALNLMQNSDRKQRVLVDSIDVVHVVLHLGDDPPEIGDKAAEYAGLVYPSQCRFRIFARG